VDARVLSGASSHIGRVRGSNQDSGYAGTHLFLVADGMGGHAGGDVASSLATQTVTAIADERFDTIDIAREHLVNAVKTSADELAAAVREHPDLTGMGTTVSALLRHNNQVVIAHIGDSRVYRFRGGVLEQITTDHTFVQKLVETGRITAEEALVHPRRNVLMRVLGDFEGSVEIDSAIFDTEPGDRWLLCSDGLCGFVPEPAIAQVLAAEPDAAKAAERLIHMTLDRGAPDNVTIVIAGVNETNMSAAAKPQLVGAAALPLLFDAVTRPLPRVVSRLFSPKTGTEAEELFKTADYLDTLIAEDKRRAAQRRSRWAVYFSLALAAVFGFGVYGYVWTQSQFFVGTDGDSVVVYRGINGDFGSIPLHTVVRDTEIPLSSLDDFVRTSVELTIPVLSLNQALLVVERIENVSQSQ
jgi:serine/threonine protein phosphatase PrpC